MTKPRQRAGAGLRGRYPLKGAPPQGELPWGDDARSGRERASIRCSPPAKGSSDEQAGVIYETQH